MPGLAGIRGQQTSDELIGGSEKVMDSPCNVGLLSQDSRLIINCLEVQTSWSKVPFRNLAAISEKQGSGQSAKGSEKLVLRSNCYWCSFFGKHIWWWGSSYFQCDYLKDSSYAETPVATTVVLWRAHQVLWLKLILVWVFEELITCWS